MFSQLEINGEHDEVRGESSRQPFDFQCTMSYVTVATPLTTRQVRMARASHAPLWVALPGAWMVEDGFYKGIVTGGSDSLEVELFVKDQLFDNDRFPSIGRVFPIHYSGDSNDHPKLQFLVQRDTQWYLSCGGMAFCWWCQSDREVSGQIEFELGRLYSEADYELY